jgi:hypothetical protein
MDGAGLRSLRVRDHGEEIPEHPPGVPEDREPACPSFALGDSSSTHGIHPKLSACNKVSPPLARSGFPSEWCGWIPHRTERRQHLKALP